MKDRDERGDGSWDSIESWQQRHLQTDQFDDFRITVNYPLPALAM